MSNLKTDNMVDPEQNVRIDVVPRLSRQKRRHYENQIDPRSLQMMKEIYNKSEYTDEAVWDEFITIVQDIPEGVPEHYLKIRCPDNYLRKLLGYAFITACHNTLARKIVASGEDLDNNDDYCNSWSMRRAYSKHIEQEIFSVCHYGVDIDMKNGYMWVEEEDKVRLVLAGIIDVDN